MPSLIKQSFSAWINKMPGSENKLIVKGEAEVPTGGWKASVKRRDNQGINKSILIIDVDLIKPTGIVTQVVSKIECRYEEAPPRHDYTEVNVIYDGDEFTVSVGEAN